VFSSTNYFPWFFRWMAFFKSEYIFVWAVIETIFQVDFGVEKAPCAACDTNCVFRWDGFSRFFRWTQIVLPGSLPFSLGFSDGCVFPGFSDGWLFKNQSIFVFRT
jgi:hypothetical protein